MKSTTTSIIDQLKASSKTITFAESCTGGRIAAAFTAIPGASAVLNGSCVTYSNQIKHSWLGVSNTTLQTHGAVSQECVREMSLGILKLAGAHYAISVSGIAGPTGGSSQKPVGTVFIAVGTSSDIIATRHHFTGDRESIQEQSTQAAIKLFEKFLKNANNS